MSTSNTAEQLSSLPAFCEGIQYFGEPWPDFSQFADSAVIAADASAIEDASNAKAAYQTLLGADALRYFLLREIDSEEAALALRLAGFVVASDGGGDEFRQGETGAAHAGCA